MELLESSDKEALKELRAVCGRIGDIWPEGAQEVLIQRNPNLLAELDRSESVLDSLLVIPNWPSPIRKQWREALAEYEKTATQCVTYAKRHMALAHSK